MEERIDRPATAFTNTASDQDAAAPRKRFESPTVVEISLCCEISAYAPDGDGQPLF